MTHNINRIVVLTATLEFVVDVVVVEEVGDAVSVCDPVSISITSRLTIKFVFVDQSIK